jgi:hypothetical protein
MRLVVVLVEDFEVQMSNTYAGGPRVGNDISLRHGKPVRLEVQFNRVFVLLVLLVSDIGFERIAEA